MFRAAYQSGTRVLLVCLVAVAAGCHGGPPARGATIDGWELGNEVVCAIDEECAKGREQWLDAGRKALDFVEANHPVVVSASLYEPVTLDVSTSGPIMRVVLELADGSWRAMAVGHVGIEPGIFLYQKGGGALAIPGT